MDDQIRAMQLVADLEGDADVSIRFGSATGSDGLMAAFADAGVDSERQMLGVLTISRN